MKPVEFRLPPGLEIPEGTPSGETFEAMSTFQVKTHGRLCLVAIGDSKMPGYGDEQHKGPPNIGGDVASRYHAEMKRTGNS